MKVMFNVNMHYDNIEKYYSDTEKSLVEIAFKNAFMDYYNDLVDIVNKDLDYANVTWDETRKLASFGPYAEDINPEYVQHIKQVIKPNLDAYNLNVPVIQYELDEYGNIRAYDMKHPDVKIWFDMTPVKKEF